jgi:hypothetical protein
MKVVEVPAGRRAPASSDRVTVTRVRQGEYQADGIVMSGRLRPILYDPGMNFISRKQALQAVLSWAMRNGAQIIYVERLAR